MKCEQSWKLIFFAAVLASSWWRLQSQKWRELMMAASKSKVAPSEDNFAILWFKIFHERSPNPKMGNIFICVYIKCYQNIVKRMVNLFLCTRLRTWLKLDRMRICFQWIQLRICPSFLKCPSLILKVIPRYIQGAKYCESLQVLFPTRVIFTRLKISCW